MIEFTAVELALLCWAVLATVAVVHFKGLANERWQLLIGAAVFTKKLALDDKLRDEMRAEFKEHEKAEVRYE